MKNLKKLNGVKLLPKNEQKHINGGTGVVYTPGDNFICVATASNGSRGYYFLDSEAEMATICTILGEGCTDYYCEANGIVTGGV
ncbi:hypothetical protein [Aquimarina rhabdastrellae]